MYTDPTYWHFFQDKIRTPTALASPIVSFDPSFAKKRHTTISIISRPNFISLTRHSIMRLYFRILYVLEARDSSQNWSVKWNLQSCPILQSWLGDSSRRLPAIVPIIHNIFLTTNRNNCYLGLTCWMWAPSCHRRRFKVSCLHTLKFFQLSLAISVET